MIELYNTRTRQLEDFEPIRDDQVTLYTCGPTVYDYQHIGNYVAYIRWDILVRTLQLSGFKVNRIINITDVGHLVSDADEGEDKLEKGAKREGKSAWEVADFYLKDFLDSMHSLNMLPPSQYARATDYIEDQITLVKKLEQKGFTYTTSDGVYFDTSKFPSYADFARLDLADQKAGARVEVNPEKRQPWDFALWKLSPKDESRDMEWDSPWGKGFPGWHLECSAIALKLLGETIDIHTGGIDHIPIHHTNEIAQSEAVTNKRFSNYWLHNNFILVDGTKISKSLNNGFRLVDLAEKGFSSQDFRLMILQSHYRTEANFTWEALEAAKSRLRNLRSMATLRWQTVKQPSWLDGAGYQQAILKALQDDLNTPIALSTLSGLAAEIDEKLLSADDLTAFEELLKFVDQALGLKLFDEPDITKDQKALLKERSEARDNKNWELSDKLRHQFSKHGLEVRDTPHGQIWSRL